ncbi:hypothetical protein [Halosegnis longus]|uniref:hypothetical protein n=1 Tax=Halosegnis longus TaxID=2216012 RepID=UPI00129D7C57|nr:hypothetical protein [Halosegnis longus]
MTDTTTDIDGEYKLFEPCPECGGANLRQEVTQTEDLVFTKDENGDPVVDDGELIIEDFIAKGEMYDVTAVYCKDCDIQLYDR